MVLAPELGDHLEPLGQLAGPLARTPEGEAVGGVVPLEPARADAEHEAAVAHLVDGGRHLREQRGVAIGVAGHHHADAQATRLRGERGQHGPAFEAGAVLVAEDGDEVVEDPRAVEAEGLGLLPGGEQVVPGDILIGGGDAEADARRRLRQRGLGEEESQGDEGGGLHAAL